MFASILDGNPDKGDWFLLGIMVGLAIALLLALSNPYSRSRK